MCRQIGACLIVSFIIGSAASAIEQKLDNVSVWVPDSLTTEDKIRIVFVHRNFAAGASLYKNKDWLALAKRYGAAQMLFGKRGDVSRSQGKQDVEEFAGMLKKAAKLTGHPELVEAAIVTTGLSRGGTNAIVMAHMMPQRMLAAIGYHGESILGLTHVGIQPNTAIPVLYLLAGNDQQRNAKIHPYITRHIRPTGAPWTTVIQPGIRHANMGDQTFVLLWLEEVIKMRLPHLDRKGGHSKLQPLSKSCWFGTYQLANDASEVFDLKGDYFKNPSILSLAQAERKGRASGPTIWLPNEIVAKAWLKYCRTGGGKLTRSSAPQSPLRCIVPATLCSSSGWE